MHLMNTSKKKEWIGYIRFPKQIHGKPNYFEFRPIISFELFELEIRVFEYYQYIIVGFLDIDKKLLSIFV